MPDDGWLPTVELSSLEDRRPTKVTVDGTAVLLVRDGDRLLAIGDRCTHQGAPLSRGRVTFSGSIAQVTCPAHGSAFDLTNGHVMRAPATAPEPAYDARVTDGLVELRKRTEP
jgi:nitrite reductase/ring-hydroxylating ferredoxin subunit